MLLNCGAGESSWESLELRGVKPVNPKGIELLIGRTDAKAEAPILSSPDAKNQLIGKDADAGKYLEQEGKGVMKDEMVGWHYRLNGHECEQTPQDSEDKEAWSDAFYGVTESDTT